MSKVLKARPGYFHAAAKQARIPVTALRVGMRVIELDRPWTETPFVFQGFRLENVQQIAEVAQYCAEVVVEYAEDEWVPATRHAVLDAPVRRRHAWAANAPSVKAYESAGRLQRRLLPKPRPKPMPSFRPLTQTAWRRPARP